MGYFNGSKSTKFEGGKMRWFKDGRIEVEMDVRTGFPVGPRSKKGLQDLFYMVTGMAPKITVMSDSRKSRNKEKYLTPVVWYSKLKEKPSVEMLENMVSKAEEAMKPIRFKRTRISGEIDVVDYEELPYPRARQLYSFCKDGARTFERVKWEII